MHNYCFTSLYILNDFCPRCSIPLIIPTPKYNNIAFLIILSIRDKFLGCKTVSISIDQTSEPVNVFSVNRQIFGQFHISIGL